MGFDTLMGPDTRRVGFAYGVTTVGEMYALPLRRPHTYLEISKFRGVDSALSEIPVGFIRKFTKIDIERRKDLEGSDESNDALDPDLTQNFLQICVMKNVF